MPTIIINIHKFMKTKHELLTLIHQLDDTFDDTANYLLPFINGFKFNKSNLKRILIRCTIKSVV